ncbi:excinuclease ABC subunit C, partial [Candidatus Curtissbacteria bacterium]|nr:excinuclease ABC subunit C [Candidatus Curtissbacteria bacterium]
SMVVFTNGEPDREQYRKFKIKFSHKPNDYQMIREVIERRFKNNWPIPDLVIIDGGRGQLNSALSAVSRYKQSSSTNKVNTFVASLAKRFEEIYTQGKIMPISLPHNSPARLLAQAIRDEAHRFAVSYHRLLRLKKLLGS